MDLWQTESMYQQQLIFRSGLLGEGLSSTTRSLSRSSSPSCMARSFSSICHHTPVSQSTNQSVNQQISQSSVSLVRVCPAPRCLCPAHRLPVAWRGPSPLSVITHQSVNQPISQSSVSQSSNQSVNQQISQSSVGLLRVCPAPRGLLAAWPGPSPVSVITHQSVNQQISQSSVGLLRVCPAPCGLCPIHHLLAAWPGPSADDVITYQSVNQQISHTPVSHSSNQSVISQSVIQSVSHQPSAGLSSTTSLCPFHHLPAVRCGPSPKYVVHQPVYQSTS